MARNDPSLVRPSAGLGMTAREVGQGYRDADDSGSTRMDPDAYRGAWSRPKGSPSYDLTWPGMDREERAEQEFRSGLRNSEGFLTRPSGEER